MISAVAARKAAQEAQQSGEQTLQPQPASSAYRPPSQRAKRTSKKQKRDRKKQKKSSLYSTPVPSIPQAQDDVIIIDPDEESEPDPHNLSEESDIEILSVPPPHHEKRAWSPSAPFHDSSSDEDMAVDTAGLIDLPTHLSHVPETNIGVALSTFVSRPGQNIFFLSADDVDKLGSGLGNGKKGTVVALGKGDRLCLLGTCCFVLLQGSIKVNGVLLRHSTTKHRVFAPRSSPLPVVDFATGSGISAINPSSLPQPLQSLDHSQAALILFQELQSSVEGLGRVCKTFEDVYKPSSGQHGSVSSPFQLDGLYLVNKQTRETAPFVLPATWDSFLTNFSTTPSLPTFSNPVFLVKGPKNYGKSTFARTLLNMLLVHYRRVAYLDCDPGQSEFTPSGLVSLNVVKEPVFGPPHTHLTLPFRAHFIGSSTPNSSPSIYLEGIKDLFEAWRIDLMNAPSSNDEGDDDRIADTIPLVVNTMGWTKGLGADLMQRIEEMIEPGEIFDFNATDDISLSKPPDFSFRYRDSGTIKTHALERAPSSVLSMRYTPADHRTLSILSYFHAVFPTTRELDGGAPNLDQITIQAWDVTRPLCAIPPYEVDLQTAFDQVVLIGAGSEDVVLDELKTVLNGALVGFIKLDHCMSSRSNPDNGSSASIQYIQARPPPPPSESSCIGLGLIRGVSFPTDSNPTSPTLIHILTPVPPPLLIGARVLVKGEMELPIWGMLDFREFGNGDVGGGVAGVEKGQVPYLQWGRGSEGAIGAEKKRVRRNLMRKGLS